MSPHQLDTPQPGINAYTWEPLTVVMGLDIVKFMPSTVRGHSDCISAIIRLNNAMLAFYETLLSVTESADL
jgi:hypothetical protein